LVGSLLFRTRGESAAQQAALDLQRVRSRRERDRRRTRAVGRVWRARAARDLEPRLIYDRSRPPYRLPRSLPLHLLPRVPHGDRRQSTRKSNATLTGRSELGVSDTRGPRRGGFWYDRGRTLRPLPAAR